MIEGKFTIGYHAAVRDNEHDGYTICLSGGGAGACSAIERDMSEAMRVASELYAEELIAHGLMLLVTKGDAE